MSPVAATLSSTAEGMFVSRNHLLHMVMSSFETSRADVLKFQGSVVNIIPKSHEGVLTTASSNPEL